MSDNRVQKGKLFMNTTVPTLAVGIDNGNSYFTAVHIRDTGEYRRVVFPNAVDQGSIDEIAQLDRMFDRPQMLPTDSLGVSDHVLEYKNQTWHVGERAFRGNKGGTNAADPKRYRSLPCLLSSLTGVAALLPKDVNQCRIIAVMCLPLEMTMDQRYITDMKKMYHSGGPYHLVYNGRSICIQDFRVGKIIAEGISPAIRHNPPEDRTSAVIDLGYFTTDHVKLRGLQAQSTGYGTIKMGVKDVANYVMKEAKRVYERELSQADTEDILRAYVSIRKYHEECDDFDIEEIIAGKQNKDVPGYPYIATNSSKGPISPEDMEQWVTAGCETVGSKITARLAEPFKAQNDGMIGADVTDFFVVGGGAYFFKNALQRVIMRNKINMSDQPEFDNADGLAYFAKAIAARHLQEASQA